MYIKSVLITGANRGLGLGMVKHFLKEDVQCIFATCRNVSKDLETIADGNRNVTILNLDVQHLETYDDIAAQVNDKTGGSGLNLLINNAGCSSKFTRLGLVKAEQLLENFRVNTVGPIMLTKALEPLLKKASEQNSDKAMGVERAAVINISSILGSTAKNDSGGFYPYRCSKAALNAATKSMSLDFKDHKILAVAVHPGWVKTDMGGKNAPLDVDTSIFELIKTLKSLTEKENGKFFQYNGEELPW